MPHSQTHLLRDEIHHQNFLISIFGHFTESVIAFFLVGRARGKFPQLRREEASEGKKKKRTFQMTSRVEFNTQMGARDGERSQ